MTYPTFIPDAGAAIASRNVLERTARVGFMVRQQPLAPTDTGWRILSAIDTEDYLADPANLEVTDYNLLCALEPALIGIWAMPVGTDLQIVEQDGRLLVAETATGRVLAPEEFSVPAPRPAD